MSHTSPKILFEDTHLVVLSKPAGLLSQGESSGEDNLVDWLRDYFGRNYVGLIHRLDRNTSGLMVVAKRTKAARRLTESLKNGDLQRIYQALLIGDLTEEGTWIHWLKKDEKMNQMRVVHKGFEDSKKAELSVRPLRKVVWKGQKLTLVEFELQTGRSHQIRVQSAAKGHPLLGDIKYGDERKELSFKRPALHSSKISFPHPMSEQLLTFEDVLPEDMSGIVKF